MNDEIPFEELLRWRLERAEAEAPPAPGAACLLKLARPWWEKWPEKFQSLVEYLDRIQILCNHTSAESARDLDGHPVPALVARGEAVSESSARVMDFNVRDGRLNLRIRLQTTLMPVEPTFEATFISDTAARPLFFAAATASVEGDYDIHTELPEKFARVWMHLKAASRMPFRLILSSVANG